MTAVEQLTPAEWCELLFADTEGWINIFAVDADGEKQSRWARNAEQFGKIIADADFRDTWVGCATRHENLGGRRGNDEECWEVPGMWLDIDVKGPTHKHENLPPDRDSAITLLKDFPLRPTVVLNSGGGLQAWWLFDEPRNAPDVADLLNHWRATWQELGQRRGWHIDNVFDVARILRVPGTKNHKTEPPIPVTIAHLARDRRFTPEDLLEYTVELPEVVEIDRGTPYDGPERPGDRYNATTDPGRLLEDHGCVIDQVNRDGSRNYRAPHRATERGANGITVFTDKYTIIYSETFADKYGLKIWADETQKKRRLYDAFGLFAYLDHGGDFVAAREALEPRNPEGAIFDVMPEGTSTTAVAAAPKITDAELDALQAALTAPFVLGGAFIFDETAEVEVRWGLDDEVLWASGESLMICGPPGVGKTTIAHQLVAGLAGLRKEVLGFPVAPAERKILYLAMDRPRQIRRAFRRLFKPEERKILDEKMIVHRGPMITDLAKRPELLYELAVAADANVVIVDSLKDAASKLSDDETGGNVNRAIQMCNAEDIDVCVLHHQRKGQADGGKPIKIDDVYGSTWLTAGCGSVVLIWGVPGALIVELIHLKQPIDVVGPLTVHHDHVKGVSTVEGKWDPLAYLVNCGTRGASLKTAAQAEHGKEVAASSASGAKTKRKLDRLVERGLATYQPQTAPGEESRYFATERVVKDMVPSAE